MMRLVLVESPYAGDVERNLRYARAALRDCLLRGEAPFASHLLYTQAGVLDDEVSGDRILGMEAGWAFLRVVQAVVAYDNLGLSPGMVKGLDRALRHNCPIEYRKLKDWK
jgi:hypothetical protein